MGGSSFRIRLLGSLELTYEGEPCSLPSSPNVRSLLAYLIFHHDRSISRDRLAGVFWPERSDDRARRALSQVLWQMRSALGAASNRLVAERQEIAFDLRADDWLDVAEFERLAGGAHIRSLAAAVDLYRADFLEGIYDDWALLERERLRELYLQVLARLIVLYKQQAGHGQALAYAQRLVAADPLHEEAHCEVMRLYHLQGRSQAALEQFAALRDLLEKELGISPAPATVALYQEIAATLDKISSPHLPVAPPPPLLRDLSHLPFVGRSEERSALLSAVHSVIGGHGECALIEGDAGVGKTRLVGEVIAGAEWRGFRVGVARANPQTTLPYQLIRDALTPLLTPLRVAQLAELVEPIWLSAAAVVLPVIAEHLPGLPSLTSLEPREELQRTWHGLNRCLAALVSAAPLLIVLEDVHWADEATLAALPHLVSRLSTDRALVLLTCRSAEARVRRTVWETLDELDRMLPLLRLRLLPFNREEADALLGRALGAGKVDSRVGSFVERLHRETGGNALFLIESLKSLLERDELVLSSSGEWVFPSQDVSLPISVSVQELVEERLVRLPSALRATLELIAVLGEHADFTTLARFGDASAASLLPALTDLEQRGFLSESESYYCFEHDRIREIVYRAIDPEHRRYLHRRAGETVEMLRPEQVESLAHHFFLGEVWDRAADYNQQAGDRARTVYANEEAVIHYTRALEALDHLKAHTTQRFEILLAREAVNDLRGEREAQAHDLALLEALVEKVGGDAQQVSKRWVQVALRRSVYAYRISDYPAVIAAAQDAIRTAQAAQDTGGEAEGYSQWGYALQWLGDLEVARAQLECALNLARAAREHRIETTTLTGLGFILYRQGDYAGARVCFEQGLVIARRTKNWWAQSHALNCLGLLCRDQNDYDGARNYYEEALRIAREVDDPQYKSTLMGNLGILYFDQGDYTVARSYHEQELRIACEIQDRKNQGMALFHIGSDVHRMGAYAEAVSYYEQALEVSQAIGERRVEGITLASLGLLSHNSGQNETALEYGRRAMEVVRDADRYIEAWALTIQGLALTDLNRFSEAVDAYEQALSLRQGLDQPNLMTELEAGLARVALAQGQLNQALVRVDKILDYLEIGVAEVSASSISKRNLAATCEPLRVYLTCYQILNACGDPRARNVLAVGYNLLQERVAGIGDERMRRTFLENVIAHRELVAAFRQAQGRQETVHLPRGDAPTGRPLREDEVLEVTWTISAPEDDAVSSKVDRRRQRLLRLLHQAAEQGAAPTVADLAAALDASERTIKRDLAALRAEGHDVRTRGS